ncbi:hypothetical protein HMPREF0591_2577 [Mycobacterium parascrofulaceum ATCC BAA-614]|uniref:Uncharacterized protein n=1 Tax=Mycobacterium parascrofulaceum ATCC BAA-614 TaxID=525368 RepID=D5P8T3_9MYCO|nr:hypothetical protein HMPREF0591_2577 [Mycobacterium parascrofulaceum ATCC BAA-614]
MARAMRTDASCAVDDLDVVVTVRAAVLGGAATAAARAGPIGG